MSIDVYQLCPCGSGKKLKFCCHAIAGEMEKIRKLQASNQQRQARQRLEEIVEQHPDNPWAVTMFAAMLLGTEGHEQAREILKPFVEQHPEHELGLVLYAAAAFTLDGYFKSRRLIHLAFQRCPGSCPDLVSRLALGVASSMFVESHYMATRQHLTLAMRLAVDRDQQDIFLKLLEFDSNRSISYPLRSVHQLGTLDELAEDEQVRDTLRKVRRLCNVGCWGTAARLMRGLTEDESSVPARSAGLWRNIGLCHAWDGDETTAAEALHEAARLETDRGQAVENELLAQLLDMEYGPDRQRPDWRSWVVNSASQALSALDDVDRLVRQDQVEEEEKSGTVGDYMVLDRVIPDALPEEPDDLDSVPRAVGGVSVIDGHSFEDGNCRVYLMATGVDDFEELVGIVESRLGSLATPDDDSEELSSLTDLDRPTELAPFSWTFAFPESMSYATRQRYDLAAWQRAVGTTWMDLPLRALGGKTPREAQGQAELDLPLTAAVYVVDVIADRLGYFFELEKLCSELGVEPLSPLPVTDSLQVTALSSVQLQRLPVTELADEQLSSVLNRALLIHLERYLDGVLREVLKRPACRDEVDLDRVYLSLARISGTRHRIDEALEWAAAGRQNASTTENAFESELQWEVRELAIRLSEPDDPQIPVMLERFRTYYLPKLPHLAEVLGEMLSRAKYPNPFEGGLGVPTAVGDSVGDMEGTQSPGGVWTPGSTPPPGGGQKLWMPGQK